MSLALTLPNLELREFCDLVALKNSRALAGSLFLTNAIRTESTPSLPVQDWQLCCRNFGEFESQNRKAKLYSLKERSKILSV